MIKYTYNGKKAVEYAKKHLLNGNPQFNNFDTDGNQNTTDCANFASQCLHYGGFPQVAGRDGWNPRVAKWRGAQSLRAFIKNGIKGNYVVEYKFLDTTEGLEIGDLLFRLEPQTSDKKTKALRNAKHVAIIRKISNEKIYIYQHGTNKKDDISYKSYAENYWKHASKDSIYCHITGVRLISSDEDSTSTCNDRYGEATLKKRSGYNAYVKNMQEDLIKLKYDCGIADGYFGNKTLMAVKQFQSEKGLTVDGLFGAKSKETLYKLVYKS